MTFKEAAKKILSEIGKPLSYLELTKYALEKGYLKTAGENPERTMNAQITQEIKYKGAFSDFKKTGRGEFALNDEKEQLKEDTNKDRISREVEEEIESKVEGGYIGKAGEYIVAGELLFRGFNAALMGVDVGSDIVAIKNGKTFFVQVKTRNISRRHNAYFFNIRIVSYERHQSGDIFYIFILRDNRKLNFLILPFHVLEQMIERNFAYTAGNGTIYRLSIVEREGRIHIGREENDATQYLNRWDIIK